MKRLFFAVLILFSMDARSQQVSQNIIIITTDGLRWQELFGGMDSAIANNPAFNQGDSGYIYKKYWDKDNETRRKKLMPFLWSTVSSQGQLYGNRHYGCNVDNANPYWFSYPGYNEIFTGYPDTAINSNSYPPNPHVTVLEFLNRQKKFQGRVAAFAAWEAFGRILNKDRSGIPVFAGYDSFGGKFPTEKERYLNRILHESYKRWGEEECFDVFTHFGAMEYLKSRKPRVLYIAYGETDEWAHAGEYRSYLDAAHQVDAWVRELWNFVQSDPQYKNKTALFITVDHGRGDKNKKEWTSHNSKIQGAQEMWFAAMGPGIAAKGEVKSTLQVYQKQFAQTVARLLGYRYTSDHPVAEEVQVLFKQ